jgi:L-2-hydroxyglutarate oxidase LhgO
LAEIANVVVIGSGIIGAAIAAEASRYYDNVFLLEALPRLTSALSIALSVGKRVRAALG